jgi:two-component system, NarL family, response regulator LiaR
LAESLTRRELDVVRLFACGATNEDIATDLCIGVRTVEFHVKNIFTKLGARDRAHALVIALREHMLPFRVLYETETYRPPMARASVTFNE